MRTRHRAGGGVMLWALTDLLLIGGLVLLSDKSGLTHRAVTAEKKAAEAADAVQERDRLADEARDWSKRYRTALAERDASTRQLEKARAEVAAVQGLLDQRDREYAALVAERDTLNERYVALKAESDDRAKRASDEIAKLNDRLAALQKERAVLQADLKASTEKARLLAEQVIERDKRVTDLNKLVEKQLAQPKDRDKTIAEQNETIAEKNKTIIDLEGRLRRAQGIAHQLLNLRSRTTTDGRPVLNRVAILIDTSSSMAFELPGVGSRWNLTKELVTTWVTHLGSKQAFIIQFDNVAKLHAAKDGSDTYDLTNEATREELVEAIRGLKIEKDRATATHDALLRAFEEHAKAPLDAIILFTDGAPTVPGKDPKEDPEEAVFRLCRQQKLPVPVNVIGVGVYVNTAEKATGTSAKEQAADGAKFLRFMIRLAEQTGGSFQAR